MSLVPLRGDSQPPVGVRHHEIERTILVEHDYVDRNEQIKEVVNGGVRA